MTVKLIAAPHLKALKWHLVSFFLLRCELIKMIESFYEFKYNRRTSDYDSHANIDCQKNIKKI